MNDKLIKNAYRIIFIAIVLCILAPITLTQPCFLKLFNYSTTGQIGDTIGGITAPILNLVGSILVFFALKAQIDANKLIQDQFDEQKKSDIDRKKILYISEQVNLIKQDIKEFSFSYKKETFKYNYEGSDAIYEFLSSIQRGGSHDKTHEEFIQANPKISELISLLGIINNAIQVISNSDISDFDKDYFYSLINYHYSSKVQQPLNTFSSKKKSLQKICNGCKQQHGIPDEIFDLDTIIRSKLNNKTATN